MGLGQRVVVAAWLESAGVADRPLPAECEVRCQLAGKIGAFAEGVVDVVEAHLHDHVVLG